MAAPHRMLPISEECTTPPLRHTTTSPDLLPDAPPTHNEAVSTWSHARLRPTTAARSWNTGNVAAAATCAAHAVGTEWLPGEAVGWDAPAALKLMRGSKRV